MRRTMMILTLALLCVLWSYGFAADEEVDVAWGLEEPGDLRQFDVVENTPQFVFDMTHPELVTTVVIK